MSFLKVGYKEQKYMRKRNGKPNLNRVRALINIGTCTFGNIPESNKGTEVGMRFEEMRVYVT